jgi:hypothetical protein
VAWAVVGRPLAPPVEGATQDVLGVESSPAREPLGEADRYADGAAVAYEDPDGQTLDWTLQGLEDHQEVTDDELSHGVEVSGFIETGTAEERLVPKGKLAAFLGRQGG